MSRLFLLLALLLPAFGWAQAVTSTTVPSATTFTSSAPSGTNGFACRNVGCRVSVGPNAGQYVYAIGAGTVGIGTNTAILGSLTSNTAIALNTGQALPTCVVGFEGYIYRLTGTGGTNTLSETRLCVCVSSGAASPVYSWRNLISGTAGNSTTCNP